MFQDPQLIVCLVALVLLSMTAGWLIGGPHMRGKVFNSVEALVGQGVPFNTLSDLLQYIIKLQNELRDLTD